jgi:hypothetical protein
MASCYGDLVSLHGPTVRLDSAMVSFHGVMVSFYGDLVSLHGPTVRLHCAMVSFHGAMVSYLLSDLLWWLGKPPPRHDDVVTLLQYLQRRLRQDNHKCTVSETMVK